MNATGYYWGTPRRKKDRRVIFLVVASLIWQIATLAQQHHKAQTRHHTKTHAFEVRCAFYLLRRIFLTFFCAVGGGAAVTAAKWRHFWDHVHYGNFRFELHEINII